MASGSASELEYLLLLSHDLRMLEQELYAELNSHVSEVKRMLASLLKKLR